MSDSDWLDDLLIAEDVSARGWKRKAVRVPRDEALAGVPRQGQLNCKVSIEEWRTLRAHIRHRKVSLSAWMRQALADKYLLEGGNPDLIKELNRGR